MPRRPEKNEYIRETRKKEILNAALSVYVRQGFHGTDMDAVADEARLAKGLLYYYYESKKVLFVELYTWMFNEAYSLSATLLAESEDMNPVEQLMYYAYGMFAANEVNPRLMQFSMRVPFDAYAIFGPDGWREGAEKSDAHGRALREIIERGMKRGLIPEADVSRTASSFWTVFVGNVFDYSKMIMGKQPTQKKDMDVFRDVVRFCFQGLGVEYSVWNACLSKVCINRHEGGVGD